MIADKVAFLGRGGVAPELGGADDVAFVVERDEAVLLAGDADAADLAASRAEFFQDLRDGGVDGLGPGGGILLEVAGRQAGQNLVGLRGGGDDAAGIGVERDGFGALRAAIDAEGDHGKSLKVKGER